MMAVALLVQLIIVVAWGIAFWQWYTTRNRGRW